MVSSCLSYFMHMLCSNRNANNVVLLSDNEDEACEMAREYIRRVSKWHGEEGRLVLYGHDLSQSQLFE